MEILNKREWLLVLQCLDYDSLMNLNKVNKYFNSLCKIDEVWINVLKRVGFIFIGIPTEDRNPRMYSRILFDSPVKLRRCPRTNGFSLDNVRQSVIQNTPELCQFLHDQLNIKYASSSLILLALKHKNMATVQWLFDKYDEEESIANRHFDDILLSAVEMNDPQIVQLIINNIDRLKIYYNHEISWSNYTNYPARVMLKAIEIGNLKILEILRHVYFKIYHDHSCFRSEDSYKLFDKILEKNDLNILKTLYHEEFNDTLEKEISKIAFADNVEFFDYLIDKVNEKRLRGLSWYFADNKHIDRIEEYDTDKTMSYGAIVYIGKWIYHVLYCYDRNYKLANYCLRRKPIYNYVRSQEDLWGIAVANVGKEELKKIKDGFDTGSNNINNIVIGGVVIAASVLFLSTHKNFLND
jgi:hypothetical protein